MCQSDIHQEKVFRLLPFEQVPIRRKNGRDKAEM
jgi:hypothetical protein